MTETLLKIKFDEAPGKGLESVISSNRQKYLLQKSEILVKQIKQIAHRDQETSITDMMYLVATMVLNIVVNTRQFTSHNQYMGAMNMFYKMLLQAFLTGGIKVVAECSTQDPISEKGGAL